MEKRIVVLCLTLVTTACSPIGYPVGTAFDSHGHRRLGPAYEPPAPLPVGRWDNVMLLPAGAEVRVLLMDGSLAGGPVVSVGADRLRIKTASGDVECAVQDVMRVDRTFAPVSSAVSDGARGAAFGAGVVGVLGVVVGRVPPARLFLAGGIVGAQQGLAFSARAGGTSIVYLASAVFPEPRPAAQWRSR